MVLNKKILLLIFGMILLIGFVGARLGTFKYGECVEIKTILNASTVNISSISYPNSSISVRDQNMTKNGFVFNYSYCNTNQTGIYIYDYHDGAGNVYENDFEITWSGESITQSQVLIYIIALIFLVLLCLGIYYLITRLPSKDAINDSNEIVQVSMLKHLRLVLWCFIWIIGIACLFIISNMGLAYIQNKMIGNLFFVLYRIGFYVTMIGVPVYFVYIFYRIFKDKEVKKLIERGVAVKGWNSF